MMGLRFSSTRKSKPNSSKQLGRGMNALNSPTPSHHQHQYTLGRRRSEHRPVPLKAANVSLTFTLTRSQIVFTA